MNLPRAGPPSKILPLECLRCQGPTVRRGDVAHCFPCKLRFMTPCDLTVQRGWTPYEARLRLLGRRFWHHRGHQIVCVEEGEF
jgi:hypothetical protein